MNKIVGVKVGILFLGIFLLLILGVSAIEIGYVVKSPDNLNDNEVIIKNLMVVNGYNVYMLNDVAFDADAYDAIVVSTSVNDIRGIFDSINHKTLFLSGSAAEKMGLGNGVRSSRRSIQVINNQNLITENYLLGTLNVYSTSSPNEYLSGCLPIGAVKLAQKSSGYVDGILIAFDEGSLLINGSCSKKDILLNEKNLFLGFHTAEKWNDDGKNLFLNSLEWLVGGEDGDGDGYSSLVDCDDTDASIHPNAVELIDNINQNCVNDKPVLVNPIPDINWVVNTDYELDLNNYFDDPEGDSLYFDIFDSSNDDEIIIEISEGVVSFSSEIDWRGEGWILFKAEDGEDFKASNKIILKVFEEGAGDVCSVLNGFICTGEQVCSGNWLNALDSDKCCSVQCSEDFEFSEIERIENLSSQLKINIENIGSGEKFEIGSTIDLEIEIKNTGSEDFDLEIYAYLYDLTNDEIIKEISKSEGLDKSKSKLIEFGIDIPKDIDEENNYAIFVKAEDGDYYNEDFILIDITRKDNYLKISEVVLDNEYLICGNYFEIRVKVENWGSNEREGYVQIQNSKLNIDEKSEIFTLEEYDGNVDDIWKTFSVKIPEGIKSDEYVLNVGVYFNLNSYFMDKSIQVSCDGGVEEGQEIIGLGKPSNIKVLKEKINKKLIIVVGLLLLSVLLVMISVLKVVSKNE